MTIPSITTHTCQAKLDTCLEPHLPIVCQKSLNQIFDNRSHIITSLSGRTLTKSRFLSRDSLPKTETRTGFPSHWLMLMASINVNYRHQMVLPNLSRYHVVMYLFLAGCPLKGFWSSSAPLFWTCQTSTTKPCKCRSSIRLLQLRAEVTQRSCSVHPAKTSRNSLQNRHFI